MKMSLDVFLDFLEKTKHLYNWVGGGGQNLRAYEEVDLTLYKFDTTGLAKKVVTTLASANKPMCPITAVYHSLYDEKIDVGHYGIAARRLGLTRHSIAHILRAADNQLVVSKKVSTRQVTKSAKLRREMIERLGLPSVTRKV